MKISNEILNPKWKEFIKHEPNNIDCTHCKYTSQEGSIPRTDFKVNIPAENGDMKETTITQIILVNGKHEDVMGWKY